MKRFTAFVMALAMALSLVGCSGAAGTSSAPGEPRQHPASRPQRKAHRLPRRKAPLARRAAKPWLSIIPPPATPSRRPNYIAQVTGGDLFALEPVEPYTTEDLNYSNEDSRVSYEHENPAARQVELTASTVENWEEYDTIFLGYPIWWGIAAWPVDGFIEANDFTGKTVIPFCTSASSGLGESGQLLAEMAGTGNWLEGQRFSSSVSQEDIQAWVESLGL